jgi:hypothetical protein
LFRRLVFAVCRNNLAIRWLAPHRQSNILACGRWNGLRCCVPKTKRIRAMGLFTRDIKTMNDLFVHQLQEI